MPNFVVTIYNGTVCCVEHSEANFATYASRHRVYSERRRLNPRRNIEGAEQTTTDNETAGHDLPRIYVNEDLSKVRSELLFVSRKAKRGAKIMDCWSYDGRIE